MNENTENIPKPRVAGPVEQLLRASLIEFKEHGGAVGIYVTPQGHCCAMGAVRQIVLTQRILYPDLPRAQAQLRVCNLLNEAIRGLPCVVVGDAFADITRFNDHFAAAGNLTPIRNVFRRAIALAMERGV